MPLKKSFLATGITVYLFYAGLALAAGSVQEELNAVVLSIKEEGLAVYYEDVPKPSWPTALFQAADPSEAAALTNYLKLFKEEMKKYPPSFIPRTGLKGVVFVKKLFYKEIPAEGFYDYRQNLIFLDFLRSHGFPIAQRHNIHHELFHVIDYFANKKPSAWNDPAWSNFNDPDFHYGKQKFPPQSKMEMSFFDPTYPGFMSAYAMTAVGEDKAETFACFMMPSQIRILNRWIKTDAILRKKVEFIKDFIGGFCPEMNEEFWKKLAK